MLKMADKSIQIADIMSSNILPIVLLKSLEIEVFIMGYHVYKSIWIPTKDAHLYVVMQAKNELNKYAIAFNRRLVSGWSFATRKVWQIR